MREVAAEQAERLAEAHAHPGRGAARVHHPPCLTLRPSHREGLLTFRGQLNKKKNKKNKQFIDSSILQFVTFLIPPMQPLLPSASLGDGVTSHISQTRARRHKKTKCPTPRPPRSQDPSRGFLGLPSALFHGAGLNSRNGKQGHAF